MSVQSAFSFIQYFQKQDTGLKDRISALDCEATLEDLVQIGAESGFVFTTDDLKAAFKQDWAMRSFLHRTQTDS